MLHPNENSSDFLSSFYTLNNLILCLSPKICLIIHFKNEYNATEDKARLTLGIAKVVKPIIDGMNPKGISLYIGIPFCPTRCLYCSFVTNSIFRSKSLSF